MRLEFTKMHGLGNDFMVIDLVSQRMRLDPDVIRRLADRHVGVGFDQLLVVEPPHQPDVDFQYRIFNADGSEVAQCGNGARCFARFVRDRKLTRKDRLRVATASGVITLQIDGHDWVTVDMGRPRLLPAEVPFVASAPGIDYALAVAGRTVTVAALSMGNPHAVLQVASVADAPVAELGPLIEHHERFPERVNVGFLEVMSRREVRLRVHERGAGETLACGTGACAAAVAAMRWGLVDREITVHLPGGSLQIAWPDDAASVHMTGPTARVFEGVIRLADAHEH